MKRKVVFPDVETATDDGLVAVGGDLEVDTLQEAYKRGIFPWPISLDFPLAWFSPDPRGVLRFDDLHLSRSFQKFLSRHPFEVTFNQNFSEVIRSCARVERKGQPGTWITPEIVTGYEKLFLSEQAFSVEVWKGAELVAGLYGVSMGDFCSGESMFTKEDNASKLALYQLVKTLKKNGVSWLDTQMVTPVVEQFGGKFMPRRDFTALVSRVDWDRKRIEIFSQ
ncbi:MAG TPA: leucyl/phenylalanyl-tRNA--protein transferase [Bacteriovoracaceae bacterium]|nr:leucyl/phenylalanyl-tRNA--protein transferase [Bacteriovoracaceae bacterium]